MRLLTSEGRSRRQVLIDSSRAPSKCLNRNLCQPNDKDCVVATQLNNKQNTSFAFNFNDQLSEILSDIIS